MSTRDERRWAVMFSLLVALITAVPYLLGYAHQGSEWRFTGYLFGIEDGNSYTAKMLLGAEGGWLFRTPYTPYPQNGVLAFLPYMLLGKLTAAPGQHEQLIALFQIFRVVGVLVYGLASYDFLALYVREISLRRLGTALAMLGGGLGWLAVVGLSGLWQSSVLGRVLPGMDLPLEFYSPETFGFLMVFGLPHLAVARGLLLWGLRDYLIPARAGAGWLRRMRPGLLWLLMGLMQPLTVISGGAIVIAHLVFVFVMERVQKGGYGAQASAFRVFFKRAVVMGLWSAPVVVYTFLAFRFDPFLRGWEQQNRIISPPPHHYLLAFGLVLVLAGWGVRALLKGQIAAVEENQAAGHWPWTTVGWLPLAWVLAFLPMAYAPYNLQRRLPDGIWVALLVLALAGIERGLSSGSRRWVLRGLAGFGFLSTLLLFTGSILGVQRPALPLYRPAAEVRGFEMLAQQAGKDAVVLAAYQTSNALPAWAPVRTLVGLGPESLNLEMLQERIGSFFNANRSNQERVFLLDEFNVEYVWYGPAERELGEWHPGQMTELVLIYDAGGYQIFRYKGGK